MMLNRTRASWVFLPAAFLVGMVLALAMVPVLASTSAIAAPASLFAWFKSHGLLPLALLSWETFVVYGLSITLPVTAAILILFRLSRRHRVAIAACLAIGVLASFYVAAPLFWGGASVSPFILHWWQQGLAASLLLAGGLALGADNAFDATLRSATGSSPAS